MTCRIILAMKRNVVLLGKRDVMTIIALVCRWLRRNVWWKVPGIAKIAEFRQAYQSTGNCGNSVMKIKWNRIHEILGEAREVFIFSGSSGKLNGNFWWNRKRSGQPREGSFLIPKE